MTAISADPIYSPPKKRRAQPEQSLQRAVVELLALSLGGNAWFSSFPAGGGGMVRGRFLKATGLKRGVPDILIIDVGKCYWLELKSRRGTLSEAQRECHEALGWCRCPVAVIRSLDEVLPTLRKWGVALKAGVAVEPRL